MKLLIKYIVIIIAFIISPELHAGLLKGMFNVRQIGHTEGLSSQRVFSIVEDKHSVIWIATKSGIDRYNGQSVKTIPFKETFIMVIWQEDVYNCCTANNMDYGPTTIREEYIGTLQKQTVSNKIYT